MSSEINLFITMSDGTVRKVTISDKKPIGALFEQLIELEGRPVYSLFKDGKEIPRSREMIKYVPLKNGDTLTEGQTASTGNIPISAYRNTFLRKQVQLGHIKEDAVMEVKIIDIHGNVVLLLLKKTDTVNDLKASVSELLHRSVNEFIVNKNVYVGWSGDMKNSLSRVYDSSQKLVDFGVSDETILQEVLKPETVQEIEKKRRDEEELKRKQEEARRQREEAQRKTDEEYRKQYEDYMRQQRRAHAPPVREVSKEATCKQMLDREGIVDKITFLKWAIANHPDKFPAASPEEIQGITERFQIISACADLLGIKNIKTAKKGGKRTRKGKKQSRRGWSRKN